MLVCVSGYSHPKILVNIYPNTNFSQDAFTLNNTMVLNLLLCCVWKMLILKFIEFENKSRLKMTT